MQGVSDEQKSMFIVAIQRVRLHAIITRLVARMKWVNDCLKKPKEENMVFAARYINQLNSVISHFPGLNVTLNLAHVLIKQVVHLVFGPTTLAIKFQPTKRTISDPSDQGMSDEQKIMFIVTIQRVRLHAIIARLVARMKWVNDCLKKPNEENMVFAARYINQLNSVIPPIKFPRGTDIVKLQIVDVFEYEHLVEVDEYPESWFYHMEENEKGPMPEEKVQECHHQERNDPDDNNQKNNNTHERTQFTKNNDTIDNTDNNNMNEDIQWDHQDSTGANKNPPWDP